MDKTQPPLTTPFVGRTAGRPNPAPCCDDPLDRARLARRGVRGAEADIAGAGTNRVHRLRRRRPLSFPPTASGCWASPWTPSMVIADTGLVVLTEHLGHGRILSSDGRDFRTYRWKPHQPCHNLLVSDPEALVSLGPLRAPAEPRNRFRHSLEVDFRLVPFTDRTFHDALQRLLRRARMDDGLQAAQGSDRTCQRFVPTRHSCSAF